VLHDLGMRFSEVQGPDGQGGLLRAAAVAAAAHRRAPGEPRASHQTSRSSVMVPKRYTWRRIKGIIEIKIMGSLDEQLFLTYAIRD
jgi:hypothetical protein